MKTLLQTIMGWRRTFRLSYLPPLMVYMAAGISGLTGIVGTFYVKERLGLSAEFLVMIAFWAGLPWAIKMPMGHIVDLMWRFKSLLIYLGAGLLATSLGIMIGLIGYTDTMTPYASVEAWFVLASLLGPIGYVIQDVVADAMTVEAVPRVDESGVVISEEKQKSEHMTMQALGRIAIISGGILVALANVFLMQGVADLPETGKTAVYLFVYELALVIPVLSVLGIWVAWWARKRFMARLVADGRTPEEARGLVTIRVERPPVNWWILGGGALFAVLSIMVGLSQMPFGQETMLVGSMAIVIFMMAKLARELSPDARRTIVGIAIIIFVFRAMPGPGPGSTWWMIDTLKFDQEFLARLGLIGSALGLAGIFLFRNFMASRSIPYIFGFLTVIGTIITLPIIGMYYGLHEWTAAHTGGLIDARAIALVDTAVESPLGQVAMVPMLAWIAHTAPRHLKATFFAVFASFTNLALSASQLGTQYLNQIYTVTREVRDAAGQVTQAADYSELGMLYMTATMISLILPMFAILLFRHRAKVTAPAFAE